MTHQLNMNVFYCDFFVVEETRYKKQLISDSCNYLYSINGSALYMVMVVHIDH